MSAETAIQAALKGVLEGIGLTVYDRAPQADDGGSDASWPYVTIGYTALSEWDTFTETGFEFTARLHTRSRSGSFAEAKTIQGQMYAALHRIPMTITGFRSVVLIRQSSDCTDAPDDTIHGVCEYRGLIQAT